MRDLNFLQVIAKQKIESKGKSSNMEKRWSWAILVIGDDPLIEGLLQLLVVAMGDESEEHTLLLICWDIMALNFYLLVL